MFVFAFLGIFSAKYRALTKDAFRCMFTTLTLRPCESNLDERIRATILSAALSRSPLIARAIHRHYQFLSVAFTVLFFASMAYSAVSVYNYWAYGNCNGPESNAFCVFDAVLGSHAANLTAVAPGVGPHIGNGNIVLVEFGCFSCTYTKLAQPDMWQFLARHPEISLEFRAFPITTHADSVSAAEAAYCADEQGKFWQYYDALFADSNHTPDSLREIARRLNLNLQAYDTCRSSGRAAAKVQLDEQAGRAAGIYGTPTFFLGNVSLVGPSSVDDFEAALRGETKANPGDASSCGGS